MTFCQPGELPSYYGRPALLLYRSKLAQVNDVMNLDSQGVFGLVVDEDELPRSGTTNIRVRIPSEQKILHSMLPFFPIFCLEKLIFQLGERSFLL